MCLVVCLLVYLFIYLFILFYCNITVCVSVYLWSQRLKGGKLVRISLYTAVPMKYVYSVHK